MARQQSNPYDSDKEKRDLAIARAAEVKGRTTQREADPYTSKRGFPNLATMTEAENATEKRQTNQRLTENATQNSKIEALKALSIAGVGTPHGQAALDGLAKIAGVTVPKTVDPKQAALNKVRAAKGLPPLGGETEAPKPGSTEGLVSQPQQQDKSLFQPEYNQAEPTGPAPGTQPVPTMPEGEATLGHPITPHLGIGGAEMTPENPTGNPANPWGAGGLFHDNPTHQAAQNQQAHEAAMYPTGPVSPTRPVTYFPGEAQDRLAGGSAQFSPSRLVKPPRAAPKAAPVMAGRNTPPNENVLPTPVNNFQRDPFEGTTPFGPMNPANLVESGKGPTSNYNVETGFSGVHPLSELHGAIIQGVINQLHESREQNARKRQPGVSVF